ncbi:adenylate kinase [Gehongia tenuis]|jgi:adenylate kinase|uniref:Adenylate kinase n=1 Tax=Gehongia tenuis TaxID=2763655 RepID=A0A926HPF0_9FIRM|nr:adenylate kinase [Gehongia tenuis]MBC8531589.1 adenylate kinase [Gehongia tenuis]
MKVVFLGPPGAGKGTQAVRISEHFNVPHISTGDIFRKNIKGKTPLGLKVQSYLDQGLLVPDDVTIEILLSRLTEADCQERGYLLDGFPRTLAQAEAVDGKIELDAVINVDVPEEKLLPRLTGRRVCKDCGATYHVSTLQGEACEKCGGPLIQRDDDKEATVLNRLKVYRELTQPLEDFYAEKGLLHTVDGALAIDEVQQAIVDILKGFQ